jgi:hypothetical protein
MNDSAHDFLDELNDLATPDRVRQIGQVLARVAGDSTIIMREVVPEEIVVAAAIVAASVAGASFAAWTRDSAFERSLSGIQPVWDAVEDARIALDRAIDYGDSWIIR